MAKRRMFNLDIVNTDSFHRMPHDAQLLYFNLGLWADDDGFVANAETIMKMLSVRPTNLHSLAEAGYITLFDSGVCLICDWKSHNYIRKDRYTPTRCQREKESLAELPAVPEKEPDGSPDGTPDGIPDDNRRDAQPVDAGKVREGKVKKGKEKRESERETAAEPPRARFSPPKLEEVQAYCRERRNCVDAQRFVDYYTANGWTQGRGKPIRDWQAAVRTWERSGIHGRDSHSHGRDDPEIAGIILR